MVPRIAKSGHSFKGAGLYYLHDKQAKTKERVMWTHTHNLPTDDPDKAFNWMAHTAMNAQRLKMQAGVAPTGRKSKAGVVYSYSLAWHPEQQPNQQTMMEAAYETLALLKLTDHEAVFVAHNDTAHPHVHIICNLVHPENGKKAVPSYDRLIMSAWAEQLEKNEGQIRCEQRVINNEKRRNGNSLTHQFNLVKHRDKELTMKEQIQHIYDTAPNGKAFQQALKDKGYTLAQGDRRGFVLVDQNDKVVTLSRQLKGQRAADIKQRLQDMEDVPHVKEVLNPPVFDRDQYETELQQKIVDAAIEEEQQRASSGKDSSGKQINPETKKKHIPKQQIRYDYSHLHRLDALMEWEQQAQRLRHRLEEQQKAQYKKKDLVKQIQELEHGTTHKANIWTSLSGKHKQQQELLQNLKKNLANINQRITEQNAALTIKLQESHPDKKEAEKQKRLDYIRKLQQSRNQSNDRDNGPELGR